jgi:hypothetical protein
VLVRYVHSANEQEWFRCILSRAEAEYQMLVECALHDMHWPGSRKRMRKTCRLGLGQQWQFGLVEPRQWDRMQELSHAPWEGAKSRPWE